MRVSAYLKMLHWSQADLARQSGISVGTVKRAMNGETISARSAQSIERAIEKAITEQGNVSITGLHVARTTRKRKRNKKSSLSSVESEPDLHT